MALDAELSNLKSAGTYRFERDLSTISNDTTNYSNLRLVVGFSKVGPFNTPMLVTNSAQFVKLYGPIDRSLEKKGSFFHRSCLVALSAGPILCLNLLNLDPDIDQVPQKSFSVNTQFYNKPKVTLPLISVYDTDKFWFASDESYLDAIDRYLNIKNTQRLLEYSKIEGESVKYDSYYKDDKYGKDYTNNILHFTNVGKKPVSILVKKASSYATTGYECTLNDWYGEENVPEYLNGTSYVSDYMVEVYVIGGDFGPAEIKSEAIETLIDLDDDGDTEYIYRFDEVNKVDKKVNPYARFTSDIVYQGYFDEDGFIRKDNPTDTTDTKLARFLNLASVNLLGKYTGSLIPNFVTKFGQNIWIQKLVNDDTNVNGVLCAENIEKLEEVYELDGFVAENIDIIGNNIPAMLKGNDGTNDKINLEFLSYKTSFEAPSQKLMFKCEVNNDAGTTIEDKSFDGYLVYLRNKENDTTTTNGVPKYAWDKYSVIITKGQFAGEYYKATDESDSDDVIEGLPGQTGGVNPFEHLSIQGTSEGQFSDTIYTYETNFTPGVLYNKIKVFNDGNIQLSGLTDIDFGKNPLITDIATLDPEYVEYGDTTFSLSAGELHTTSKPESPLMTVRGNEVLVPVGANIVAGDYIISYVAEVEDEENGTQTHPFSRLTRVVETRGVYADTSKEDVDTDASDYKYQPVTRLTKVAVKVVCSDVVYTTPLYKQEDGESEASMKNYIKKFKTVDQFAEHFQWTCLKGYQLREELMPNGTNERQNYILDVLREEPEHDGTKSNLYKTLCDRDYIQWRYLVDTFGGGIEQECKKVYTLLCQGRQSALALINCPSQAEFKKSLDPSFVNSRNSVEAEYIAKGGDSAKTPSFLFSLPKLENGASWGAYYYPFLKISDLSAPKSVPPAAYVSNLYIAKYNSAQAWSIVAGQRRGVISGNQVIGVEATLVHDNRDWLEPAGINAIIWENGVGVEVYANKTAKQTPKSALSSIHVREACIYIQDNVEQILRKYVFEMNTAQTRLEIKTLVDNFLETVKADSGVYEYKTVMDTSNNTPEVIDNNMGVIDIYIEPVRGLEILTQRLTVMKTGGIKAGAFE